MNTGSSAIAGVSSSNAHSTDRLRPRRGKVIRIETYVSPARAITFRECPDDLQGKRVQYERGHGEHQSGERRVGEVQGAESRRVQVGWKMWRPPNR